MKKLSLLALLLCMGLAAKPQAIINEGQTVQINNLTDATGGADLKYKWVVSKNNGVEEEVVGATAASYTTPATLTAGMYRYRRVAYSTECNAGAYTAAFTVTVQACASTPSVTAVTNGAYCSGFGTSVSAGASGGAVVDWYADTIGVGTNTPLLMGSSTYYTPSLTADKSYWVQARSVADGCLSPARRRVKVTQNPTPAAPTTVTAGTACSGGSATLKATPNTNANTVRWYSASSGGTMLLQGTTYNTPDITAATTYYVSSYNSTTGCESSARTAVVANINAKPNDPTTTGDAVCSGNAATLNAVVGINGNTIRWYDSNTSTTVLGQGATFITPAITAARLYYATSYNTTSGCESDRKGANITMSTNLPIVTPRLIPAFGAVTVLASATGGTAPYSYAFSLTPGASYWNTTSTSSPTTRTIITTTPGTAATNYTTTILYVRVKDSKGCISAEVTSPTTFSMPEIPATTSYCAGCGYDGYSEVDLWIGPNVAGGILTNAGFPGGQQFSLNDGRANTERINAVATKGTGLSACIAQGANWYVPSYGESRRLGAMGLLANLNTLASSTIASTAGSPSTWPLGIIWNPSEPNGYGGTEGCLNGSWVTQSANDISCITMTSVVCTWRP